MSLWNRFTFKIPKHLLEYFEQNGNQIKTIGGFLLALAVTNYIPHNWWQSWLLNWELSSQSVISILSIMTLLCHSLYWKVKKLESRLKSITDLQNNNNPEQRAENVVNSIKNTNKFLSALSSKWN